ncbi:hypothetical protein [Streptomyces sp. NPDC002403]
MPVADHGAHQGLGKVPVHRGLLVGAGRGLSEEGRDTYGLEQRPARQQCE